VLSTLYALGFSPLSTISVSEFPSVSPVDLLIFRQFLISFSRYFNLFFSLMSLRSTLERNFGFFYDFFLVDCNVSRNRLADPHQESGHSFQADTDGEVSFFPVSSFFSKFFLLDPMTKFVYCFGQTLLPHPSPPPPFFGKVFLTANVRFILFPLPFLESSSP